MLDCHGRLNVANAIRLAEALEPYDLTFIEEPVPYERPDWLRDVSSRVSTPIAAGERWGNHLASAPFIEQHSVAIAQPDVGICGGLTVSRKIATLAEVHGISVAFHNPFGPLQSAATWHRASIRDVYDLTDAGILTTASDLLFTGGREGYFQALDARTGELLWKASLGSAQIMMGPITYEVEGRQYVSVICGNVMATFGL